MGRVVVLIVLVVLVFAALRLNDQPGLAVSLYALVPILLGLFWFELLGGLLMASAAMLSFLIDELLTPTPTLSGADLGLATFNRSMVFFGVALLVTGLLRRERRLTLQVRQQQAELAELESLRAVLTPSELSARPHLQFATSFTPAEGVVAGDFFLVVDGPQDSTTVVVGDVVGHGLEAARCAAFVRAALATFARFSGDPAQLLQLANTALAERDELACRFVTAVCVNIGPPPRHELRWAAAGHEPPWRLDVGTPLSGGMAGAPLGIGVDPIAVEAGHGSLATGAGILLFTDGLTEGRSARRLPGQPVELFGEERARQVIRAHSGAPVDQVLEALAAAVTAFAGSSLADDLCLVAVRAQPPADTDIATTTGTKQLHHGY